VVTEAEAYNVELAHYRELGTAFFDSVIDGIRSVQTAELAKAVQVLDTVRTQRSRVYALGNGGSASAASHLVCDLSKIASRSSEPPLRAFALADNNAILTAYANDVSYAEAFALQLEANADPGDVVVAISASGRSPNVLSALRIAREIGLSSIGLLGFPGEPAAGLVDIPLVVDSTDFGVIETVHIGIIHALAKILGESRSGCRARGVAAMGRTP
jgi:D-sedoheptulose 7-phosphate isomerase